MRACHSAGPVWWTLVPFGGGGYGDGHVDSIELVDGFHAEVGEGESRIYHFTKSTPNGLK